MEFARTTFTVTTVGDDECANDLSGEFTLNDFPQAGESTIIHWEPGLQTFLIGQAGDGSGAVTGDSTRVLENPGQGTSHSGVDVISGWACEADIVEIVIDGSITLEAAYGTSRPDTEDACGDRQNGFSLLLNWNLLTDGEHTISVRADGEEFATTTFTATTLGAEFLSGVEGQFTLEDFPEPGVNTLIEWLESLQNFIIIGTISGP